MTTRKEFQDIANTYSKAWTDCDPAVGKAIERFHAAVTPSHSLTSKKFSLTSLIREHLDEIVGKFLSSFLSGKPERLSAQVRKSPRAADDYLINAMKEYQSFTNKEELDTHGEVIQATVDSLRDLVRFCEFYVSEDVSYVSNIDNSPLTKKRTKKRGSSETSDLPNYLLFRHGHYCQFCDQPTEKFVEYVRNTKEIVDIELEMRELKYAKTFRENINNTRIKGYSSTYCAQHNPEQDKSNYNKALKKKVAFYSVMRLLIDIPKRNKIQPLDEYELRVVAYRLIESYPEKNKLSRTVILVADFYEKKDIAEKQAALVGMTKLYQAFMEWYDEFLSLQKNTGSVFILPTL